MSAQLWDEANCDPSAEPHVVHLYRTPSSLYRGVVAWIKPCLEEGGGAVLVCEKVNASRITMVLREEGLDTSLLQRDGRLVLVSMDEFMPRFITQGKPDGETFKHLASEILQKVCTASSGNVRAWGEMVNKMWKEGNAAGAHQLEELWNEVIAAQEIQLLCSYDVADVEGDAYTSLWSDVCSTHGHLVADGAQAQPSATTRQEIPVEFVPQALPMPPHG